MHSRVCKGSSLVEYAIPLGIFFVAGLAVLMATDVPTRLQEFFADTTNGTTTGGTVAIVPYGTVQGSGGTAAGMGDGVSGADMIAMRGLPLPEQQPGEAPTEQVCFNSGACLDIPVIGQGASIDETAGGLGGDEVTAQLAEVLTQIAEQIAEADPPPDPQIVAMITDLANSGHELAAAEADIPMSSFAGSGTGAGGMDNQYNALMQMQHHELAAFQQNFRTFGDFLANNPDALSMFPEAEYIINMEAGQILEIANGYVINESTENEAGVTMSEGILTNGAELTEQNSNVICANGGNMSSCTSNSQASGGHGHQGGGG